MAIIRMLILRIKGRLSTMQFTLIDNFKVWQIVTALTWKVIACYIYKTVTKIAWHQKGTINTNRHWIL